MEWLEAQPFDYGYQIDSLPSKMKTLFAPITLNVSSSIRAAVFSSMPIPSRTGLADMETNILPMRLRCEKWLKDRKCRVLSGEDITHYQRVVVALKEIDKFIVKWSLE